MPDREAATVLALDLEGTLISNAVSVFVRPGLFEFLEWCAQRFGRVVLFTAVTPSRVREVQTLLVAEASTPRWFGEIEVVHCRGSVKDLGAVGADNWRDVWLVDDVEAFVLPEQRGQWVRIEPFLAPYPDADRALVAVQAELEQRLTYR